MALRGLTPLALFSLGSFAAVACGGASDTDFGNDDGSAGDSAEGGNGGSSRGGSSSQGGSPQGGASGRGGTGQGGSDPNGGASSGGGPNGGASGTGTGGETTGGAGGTSSGGGSGGSGGPVGGAGGTSSGGMPSGGTGGLSDCSRTIAEAQAALVSAQVCDSTAAAKCTGKVEDLCGCLVPVNDAASQQTQTYLELREAAIKCGVACPAIVCPEPTTVTCGFGGATTRIVARAQCMYSPR